MKRRTFLATSAAAAAAAPFAARAQARLPLVGYLSTANPDTDYVEDFVAGLADLGYELGRDYRLEVRYSEGVNERLVPLAEELVDMEPDVVVGRAGLGPEAMAQVTQTIPIVAPGMGARTQLALVGENFGRPAGNVTGIMATTAGLAGKRLQILSEAFPGAAPIGHLHRASGNSLEQAKAAAADLGIPLLTAGAAAPEDIAPAVTALVEGGAAALDISAAALFTAELPQVVGLVAETGLPAMFGYPVYVRNGGLMAYGIDFSLSFRRAAYFVDRILKGAVPGDLPVELPSPFLAINLITAAGQRFEFPLSILVRAEPVVE